MLVVTSELADLKLTVLTSRAHQERVRFRGGYASYKEKPTSVMNKERCCCYANFIAQDRDHGAKR